MPESPHQAAIATPKRTTRRSSKTKPHDQKPERFGEEVSQVRDTQPLSQRPDTIKQILDLREKGVSYRIISLAVDLSHETVRRLLNSTRLSEWEGSSTMVVSNQSLLHISGLSGWHNSRLPWTCFAKAPQ